MSASIDLIGGSFVLIMTSIIFAMILLEKKEINKIKNKIIKLLIGMVIYIIITNNTTGTLKTLLVFLFHVIQYRNLFKLSYSDAIFLSFLYIVLAIIPEIIILFYLVIVLKIDTATCYEYFTSSIVSTISVSLLLLLIVFMFRKVLRKIIRIKINNNKIIIYTILTLSSVLVIFYTIVEEILIKENVILSIFIMIVFVVILYSLIRQKMENNKILEKYDKLLEFIKKYEIIIEEQREIRHESKNQLITVKSKVLNKEDGEEIIKYVDSLLKDHKSYKEDKYGMFQYLPSNGIKGLFYYKAMEAEEKGINLSIRIAERVEDSILSKLETEDFKQLGRLIGVYIDNAIEASNLSEEKKLGIEIYKHNEDVIMIISNTYDGEIDTELVGKVRYSTKGNNRGHGLMLVNKILNGSNRFVAERTITDKLYIQKLVIKND